MRTKEVFSGDRQVVAATIRYLLKNDGIVPGGRPTDTQIFRNQGKITTGVKSG